ncbi:MAG: primosomal protein N', partial [Acidobacteriales bacterium]|nr:primosomal protein N' [Terriglobales bacterium]
MPRFCDVALPVPLDSLFTYAVPEGAHPVIGGRVLVPFRQQRLSGIVLELHDREPSVQAKDLISVLDDTPVLDAALLRLARWVADYYLAPLGDVFRSMLPLSAEFKRTIGFRITEDGHAALHAAGTVGSSRRARKTPDEQLAEVRVLDYLAARDSAWESTLRTATGASRLLLAGMLRKKWIAREDLSDVHDVARTEKVAVLKSVEGKLNSNQKTLLDTIAAAGGEVAVKALTELDIPRSTLATLVKRGLIEIVERPAERKTAPVRVPRSPLNFQFN